MSTTTRCNTLLILVASATLCGAGPIHGQPRDSAPASAEAAQDAPRFDILEYQIEGNTVLATLAVEKAVYPYLGEGKTVADVERARQALEDLELIVPRLRLCPLATLAEQLARINSRARARFAEETRRRARVLRQARLAQ